MSLRLIVRRRGFSYPDAASLPIVLAAGGFSKLSRDVQRTIRFVRAEVGDYCDDMPAESAARYLERGDLELVSEAPRETARDDVAKAPRRSVKREKD